MEARAKMNSEYIPRSRAIEAPDIPCKTPVAPTHKPFMKRKI
jgi:hypothetical protein